MGRALKKSKVAFFPATTGKACLPTYMKNYFSVVRPNLGVWK
jgi:hypothetical protein